jgi:hypothetical protein
MEQIAIAIYYFFTFARGLISIDNAIKVLVIVYNFGANKNLKTDNVENKPQASIFTIETLPNQQPLANRQK